MIQSMVANDSIDSEIFSQHNIIDCRLISPDNSPAAHKSELLLVLLDHFTEVGLWAEQVAHHLPRPPGKRVPVQPGETLGDLPRDGQRQEVRSRGDDVDDGEEHDSVLLVVHLLSREIINY